MNKILLKQIWNRRRTNLGVCIELFLVFILVWYIVDYIFVTGYTFNLPSHRNLDHTMKVVIDRYPENAPEYRKEGEDEIIPNFSRLYNMIGNYRGVKNITYTEDDSYPGSGSFSGSKFVNMEDTTRQAGLQMFSLLPFGDYFGVFGYTTADGIRNVSVYDFGELDLSRVYITANLAKQLFPDQPAVGKWIKRSDGKREYEIGGVVGDIKALIDERPSYCMYIPVPMDYNFKREDIMAFAIKVDSSINEKEFLMEFSDYLSSQLNVGNYYLKKVIPFNDILDDMQYETLNELRIRLIFMGFFLVCISLCLIGTFWYRIVKRRNEIGLRMSFGSTPGDIRRIVIMESLILLTFSAILAVLVEINIVNADLLDTPGWSKETNGQYLPDKTWFRFMITNALTWIIMAVITILSVWFPAQSASTVNPVEALRDE